MFGGLEILFYGFADDSCSAIPTVNPCGLEQDFLIYMDQ